jgi:hypothetical protein
METASPAMSKHYLRILPPQSSKETKIGTSKLTEALTGQPE